MSMPKVNLRTERVARAWFAETRSNAIRAVVLIHSDDPELKRRLMPQLEAAIHRISEKQKEVAALIGSARARALFDEAGSRRTRYLELSRTAFEMKKAGRMEEAVGLLNTSMLPALEAYIRSIKGLVEHYTVEVERDVASASVTAQSTRNLLIRGCAAGVLLGILLSWWIASSIPEPIRQRVTVGRRMPRSRANGSRMGSLAFRNTRAEKTGWLGSARRGRLIIGCSEEASAKLGAIRRTMGWTVSQFILFGEPEMRRKFVLAVALALGAAFTAGTVLAAERVTPKEAEAMIDLRDGDGKEHIRERMELAKTKSMFWHDFKFVNPVNKKMEPKSMYCERADELVVCGGIYKPM